ncbi:MAG: lysine--tRNA ligase [Bdellovibrionales bacterium]|nr:lysine--tRNA ligase [Bdellovibrionales bacterium]
MEPTRSEQERIRREKLERLRALDYPYPNDVVVTATSGEVLGTFEREVATDEAERSRFTVAGRMMSSRMMGKAAFFHLQDRAGRLQCYVRKDVVGEEMFEHFSDLDLGDILEVRGFLFQTKTGEPTLRVEHVRLLTKCLHPLPEKWHGLSDVEVRYRQRYLDLIVNQEVKETFLLRAKVIAYLRRFFDARGYIEVETPTMHSSSGGATARPFHTHHNALGIDLFLRIALELPLKRLIVGGMERVYEIGRVFRNEGLSRSHNPEFTMLEFYEAFATYETLMDLTEELLSGLVSEVCGSQQIEYGGKQLNFQAPWKRLSMVDSIYEFGGISRDIDLLTMEGAREAARQLGLHDVAKLEDYGLLLYEIFDQRIEDCIVNPTFITRHPLSVSPLARPSLDDNRFTDRFELMVAGMEIANAFSELNDPDDQRRRFEAQLEAKRAGDEEAMDLDEDFIAALEYGMPPTAGQGIGIDRLVMLLSGAQSIRDVILFPQMRPLAGEATRGQNPGQES